MTTWTEGNLAFERQLEHRKASQEIVEKLIKIVETVTTKFAPLSRSFLLQQKVLIGLMLTLIAGAILSGVTHSLLIIPAILVTIGILVVSMVRTRLEEALQLPEHLKSISTLGEDLLSKISIETQPIDDSSRLSMKQHFSNLSTVKRVLEQLEDAKVQALDCGGSIVSAMSIFNPITLLLVPVGWVYVALSTLVVLFSVLFMF